MDVFLEELTTQPLEREVEFSINLIPSKKKTPIFWAPCPMAQAELAELKEQLNTLLGQGFIRLSISPWGTSVLLLTIKVECRDYVLTIED